MKKIKLSLFFVLFVISAFWIVTDWNAFNQTNNFRAWRDLLIQYSGLLGIGVMSVGMVLALRPSWLESTLGGLDKMYRLHKWMGIAGLTLAITHWLIIKGPKWLTNLGLLERQPKGPKSKIPDPDLLQQFFSGQRGLAKDLGEWSFYAAIILIVIALVKWFPYRYFFKTHRLLALVYLLLAWHSVVLLNYSDWKSPVGLMLAVLLASGVYGAVMVLFRKVAIHRQRIGEVASIRSFDALKTTEINIQFRDRWPGHRSGQFAFLTLHEREGAHPFTIASAWANDGKITFIIKALGDYTRNLSKSVHIGDVVKVEGPYGQFTFRGNQPRQIWVGAGIGITPFISRLQHLQSNPDGKQIDLFYVTSMLDDQAVKLIENEAQVAGVTLHVITSQRDGRLDANRIMELVAQWNQADVWFCGPSEFGRSLRLDFNAAGLPANRFHQELFEMR